MTHVFVTGANRGIGLAIVKRYLAQGKKVTAACRKASEALYSLDQVKVIEGIDVGDGNSVAKLAAQIDTPIDILINNAGIMRRTSLEDSDLIGETLAQFQVNTLGPMRVMQALREKLSPNAKVALITSRMGSIEDNTSGGSYGYRISKVGLNMFGKSLALDLKSVGYPVAIIHPGFVQTDMTGGSGHMDADESAEGISARIEELNLENTGTFWHSNGEVLPW